LVDAVEFFQRTVEHRLRIGQAVGGRSRRTCRRAAHAGSVLGQVSEGLDGVDVLAARSLLDGETRI
jgi:hypothetical protein